MHGHGLALLVCLTILLLASSPRGAHATPPPDPERFKAARPAHEAREGADVVALHAGLGLADIYATGAPGQFGAMQVMFDTPSRTVVAPMTRVGTRTVDGVEREVFRARIMSGSPALRYTIWGDKEFRPGLNSSTPSAEATVTLAPSRVVPQWAMGAVWYQIFPERFRNANRDNDPRGSAVFLADWFSDWYKVQPGELEAWRARRGLKEGQPTPARTGGDLYHVIWDRRYGGDLQGVAEKFAELRDLGVTAIYLNPIFEAESLHKYDASDFRHIDAWLGTPAGESVRPASGTYTPPAGETSDPSTWGWTAADRYFIDVFLPEARRHGLRVILDGVWNHTGRQFWAFQDVREKGRRSPYADWFNAEFGDDGALTGWSGWEGKNGWLPEFRQVRGGLTRERDETVERGDLSAGVKEHIYAVTRRWMDPNNDGDPSDGIDGWRLDVAGEVGKEFWNAWRAEVLRINPEAITIAEIWSDASEWIDAGSFDTQMHYPFAFPVLDWLMGSTPRGEPMTEAMLHERLEGAFKDHPATNLIHQNLFASHDTARYVNILWNPGREYDRDAAVQEGADQPRANDPDYVPYKAGKPDARTYALSLLGVAIQATYTGAPMVYYGDEYGMWGADDPTCRKPVPWPDQGTPANPDEAIDPALRERYRFWLTQRAHPEHGAALRYGALRHLTTGRDDVFAFERTLNDVRVVVVVNRGDEAFDAEPLAGKIARGKSVAGLSAEMYVGE